MQSAIHEYFGAEKFESAFFLAAGLAGIILGAYLFFTGSSYRTAAYPLIAVALIQIVVGASVYWRTDAQVRDLISKYESNPAGYASEENVRMGVVNRNFEIYKGIEIFLLLTGILLTYFFRQRMNFYAAGIGLISEASLMLVLDLIAEKRAWDYLEAIGRNISG